jgi:DNA-binding NtrC family response regulator
MVISAKRARVLVVDDDQDVRNCMVEMLNEAGHDSLPAGGASEAIELVACYDFDLLVTDVAMPGLSGFLLAQQAKRLQPNLRVIFATGRIQEPHWDWTRFGPVLHKPFRADALIAEVERLLPVAA